MQTVAVEKAQESLPELIRQVANGAEVTITQNGKPAAKLTAIEPAPKTAAKAGSLRGQIWLSDDFDAPLEDLKEYQE
ncbi:MAG: type II toxin-antitoxin system Phd/YefM family antitoxin [Limisphaerales bacterium]